MSEFILKEEHLKLLERACIYWEDAEFGAPAIDCKRPFGNSGAIYDIMEILGCEVKRCPHCDEVIEGPDEDKLMEIYRELDTAIEIIFQTRSTTPGKYRYEDRKWYKVPAYKPKEPYGS